ncbi:MAG: hypothetical protein BWY46_01140 [Firmicutes bacterium ADurb.Bin300]|nr:MAG: hypothetical protein BWY46_01140 [Firmicutes bacterium ADurb.Bin300]HOD01716.1 hypothetical protein [Clostridiales bacterium]
MFWRISITALGLALILISLVEVLLYFFGETAVADVSVRRVGGANGGRIVSQRYEWSIDYSFSDKTGVSHSGHSTRRGNDISVKTENRVYYFPFAPYLNALKGEAKPNLSQPLYVLIGALLIYVMNKRSENGDTKKVRT